MGTKNLDLEGFLEGQDTSLLNTSRTESLEEQETSLYVKTCYLLSGDKKAWDVTPDEWIELEEFGMVKSQKKEMGTSYYLTEKALNYIESVDHCYKSLVKKERHNSGSFWDDCNSPIHTVDGITSNITSLLDKQ